MAVSGHSSEGQAGSQGRGRFSCRLLSPLVRERASCVVLGPGPSSPATRRPQLPSWVQDAILGQGAATGGSPRELGKRAPENWRVPTPYPRRQHLLNWLCSRERRWKDRGDEEKRGKTEVGWEGSGFPQEGRLQESKTKFGSRRTAGPSDWGLGEAGGGPWTHASSVGAEGEGGQGGLGEGSRGEGGTPTRAACGSEAPGLPGRGDLGPRPRSAASARPRPSLCRCEAFKDTSAPAQRGCVCVSVSACVLVCTEGVFLR